MITDEDGDQTMSAHELARALLNGPDLPVRTEGCDCWGTAFSLKVIDNEDVVICRDNGDFFLRGVPRG
jgi:hypothetical protein